MIVLEQDTILDFKEIRKIINSSRLSFAKKNILFENLGVKPGSVSPLAMINNINNGIKIFLERKLRSYSYIFLHQN